MQNYETNNYKLEVKEIDGKDMYVLINKETGVMEHVDPVLPRTIELMRFYESSLTELNEEDTKGADLMIPKPPKLEFPH